jgi:hypothetical protein
MYLRDTVSDVGDRPLGRNIERHFGMVVTQTDAVRLVFADTCMECSEFFFAVLAGFARDLL